MVALAALKSFVEDKAKLTKVTCDCFEMEPSTRVSPQLVELQSFGVVPTMVVENG